MALVTTIRIDRLAELEAKERRLGLLENWTSPFLLRAFEKYMRNYEEAETVRSRQERDKRRP